MIRFGRNIKISVPCSVSGVHPLRHFDPARKILKKRNKGKRKLGTDDEIWFFPIPHPVTMVKKTSIFAHRSFVFPPDIILPHSPRSVDSKASLIGRLRSDAVAHWQLTKPSDGLTPGPVQRAPGSSGANAEIYGGPVQFPPHPPEPDLGLLTLSFTIWLSIDLDDSKKSSDGIF